MNLLDVLFSGSNAERLSALIMLLYRIPAVLIALTMHEVAHGYVAKRCGDNTAAYMGRLSLNPLDHLDPIGTVCMALFGFGWAKPVPVNTRNFKNYRRDDLMVSLAGITVNLILFVISTLIMFLINRIMMSPELWEIWPVKDFLSFEGIGFNLTLNKEYYASGSYSLYLEFFEEYMRFPWLLYIQRFFMIFSMINLGLAVFNLLPVPPMDGWRVANVIAHGRLSVSPRVAEIIKIVFLIVLWRTDFISNILSRAMYFVQGGLLDGLLLLFGLK